MAKRCAATILWFFAAATTSNLVALASDLPQIVNVLAGAAVAGFVWLDPLRILWTRASGEASAAPSATIPGALRTHD